MDINVDIIRGIYSVGFEKPSAIQRKSIPHMISGNDMIVQSEAGSGKTGAYVIGMLNKINQKSN
jgi:superfamily II DNA/RNA helicase